MTDATAAAAIRLLRRQFDFTPPEVARAWLPRLESLLVDLDADQSYPADWMVFRVSGVSPADGHEAVVARGAELVPALVALIEERHRALGPFVFDDRTDLDADEAATMLGVSRRTLQRWRLDGLPMLRLRRADGRDRTGLRRNAIDRFVERHPDRVAEAARYRRMDEDERSAIVAGYERMRSEGRSITAAIDSVAATTGRSANAVRAVVSAVPARSRRGLDLTRRRRFFGRALDRGIAVDAIAARVSRSPDVVKRADLDRRRRRAFAADPQPIVVPNAARPEAAEVFAVAGGIDDTARSLAGATLGDWLDRIRALPSIEDEEATRARIAAMHFAGGRARTALDRLVAVARPGDRRLDPIESDLRWWGLLLERSMLRGCAEGLRRLEQAVGRRIEQLPSPRVHAGLTLVLGSVSEVVLGFDPARRVSGHTLDRAVALGVGRRLARESGWEPVVGALVRGRLEDPVPVDPLAILSPPLRSLLATERWWRRCPSALRDELTAGDGGEAFRIRFGFEPEGRPRSLLETGRRLGVAPTRIAGPIDETTRRLRHAALDRRVG